jgi:hypothetical protein
VRRAIKEEQVPDSKESVVATEIVHQDQKRRVLVRRAHRTGVATLHGARPQESGAGPSTIKADVKVPAGDSDGDFTIPQTQAATRHKRPREPEDVCMSHQQGVGLPSIDINC